MDNSKAETTKLFKLVSGFLAFVLWGGWAFYVNGDDSLAIKTKSALAQGTASFIITLIMVRIVTFFYNSFNGRVKQILLYAILTLL